MDLSTINFDLVLNIVAVISLIISIVRVYYTTNHRIDTLTTSLQIITETIAELKKSVITTSENAIIQMDERSKARVELFNVKLDHVTYQINLLSDIMKKKD